MKAVMALPSDDPGGSHPDIGHFAFSAVAGNPPTASAVKRKATFILFRRLALPRGYGKWTMRIQLCIDHVKRSRDERLSSLKM